MVRSRSTPNLEKETTLKRMDSFFRVIPSTPHVEEAAATTPTPTLTPTDNNEDENEVDDAEDIPE
ncbi:hypothetical protein Hanom_Chr14g01313311 [Helianthus anomalus]